MKLEQEQLRQDVALLLKEDRLQAAVRAARYQQALRRYHSRKVNARSFEKEKIMKWIWRHSKKYSLAGTQTTEKLSCQSLNTVSFKFF